MLRPVPIDSSSPPYEGDGLSSAADGQARARREGSDFDELSYEFIEQAGGRIVQARHRVAHVTVDAHVEGRNGAQFWLLAHGNVDVDSKAKLPGLRRTDTIRKAGASAHQLAGMLGAFPVLVLTSHLPNGKDQAAQAWLAGFANVIFDVVSIYGDLAGFHRLQRHLTDDGPLTRAAPGDWVATPGSQLSLDNMDGWRT